VNPRKVLLVEDERDTRELLGRALERAGYSSVLAESVREARERALTSGPFDVVVTDVVLGRDDRGGLRLMTELRDVGVRAPFVIITAYADVEKLKIALNQGAAHLLEKPFRAPELIAVIARICGEDAAHGPRSVAPASPEEAVASVLSSARLTAKERTVALHLLRGLSSGEIAKLETNSPKTIRQHVSQIYAKCGVRSRAEFFRLVYSGGIASDP
jgi:DNA-binding NarL/FixJ family response regulator